MANGEGSDLDVGFEKKMLSLKNLASQRKIKKILKEEKFDKIVLNTTLAAFNVRMAMKRRGRPFVLHIAHGLMFTRQCQGLKEKIFRFAERYLSSRTDAIIVMNEEDRLITDSYRLTAGPVFMTRGMGARVKSRGVSCEEIRRELGAEGKYLITFVGELSFAKGQDTLIRLLPKIKEIIPEATLLFIGEGKDRDAFDTLSRELGVQDSVQLVGRRECPEDYVRASDLYIAPSLKEGLPFNVIEALGVGITVIASDIKGQRDIIKDGESGFLYPLGDFDRLLSLIEGVYTGKLTLDKERILEAYRKYSFDEVFPNTYGIISDLMK